MKTQHEQLSEELEAAREEIKRLNGMLLEGGHHFACTECCRVFDKNVQYEDRAETLNGEPYCESCGKRAAQAARDIADTYAELNQWIDRGGQ